MATKSPFAKIEREESLSQKIESQIRDAIRQKVFLPGDKLPSEFELAEKFGVSRTAVREALQMLSVRGLVDIRRGSGGYVTEMGMATVVEPFYDLLEMNCGGGALLHILRIRLFMETENTRIAVPNSSEEDIEYLQEKFNQMVTHKDDIKKNIENDIKFHRRIAAATKNPLIPIIMEPIFQLLQKYIPSDYKPTHDKEITIKFHGDLVKHFKNRDAEAAADTMHEHLTFAEKHIVQYYKSIGYEDTTAQLK
jgi:GntR family transcriptional repressor for pyruvate dehydrogenase complex